MPTNPPNTDNHNLPKVPPLDVNYADEWGYILNDGTFKDGTNAGTPGLIDALEERTPIVDTEANQSNYTPHSDAIYIASDTARIFFGDGSSWNVQALGTSSNRLPNKSYFTEIDTNVINGQSVVNSSDGEYEIQKDGTDGQGIINFKTQ